MKPIGLHQLGTLIIMLTALIFAGCGGGGNGNSAIAFVPPILATGASFNIDESANSGTIVGSLVINSAGSAPVTSIGLSGVGSGLFAAHTDGTIIIAEGAAFDYETASTYTLSAVAVNSAGSGNVVPVTINVNDVPESAPALGGSTLSIAEAAASGVTVGTVTILSSGGAPITAFTLTGTGADKFAIDATGTITLAGSLDYEATPSYALSAVATNSVGDSAAADVAIHVTNVAENAPALGTAEINLAFDVSIPKGTVLAKIPVTSDGGGDITRIYAIGPYADKLDFAVDGTITVATTAFETPGSTPPFTALAGALQVYAENGAGASTPTSVQVWLLSADDAFSRDHAALSITYNGTDTAVGITQSIGLPTGAPYLSTVTWSSDHTDVISPNGQVTRPPYTGSDTVVKVYKKLKRGSTTKSYTTVVTVLKEATPVAALTPLEDALYTLAINPKPGERTDKNGNPLPTGFNPLRKKNASIFNTYELAAFTGSATGQAKGIYETLPDENLFNQTPVQLKAMPNATTWAGKIKAGAAVNADNDVFDELAFAYIADNKDIMLYVIDDASGSYNLLYGPAKIGTAPFSWTDQSGDNGGDLDMASGDIDGDGRSELTVTAGKRWFIYDAATGTYKDASPTTGKMIVLNDAAAGFAKIAEISLAGTALRVTTADTNNDGKDEIAVAAKQSMGPSTPFNQTNLAFFKHSTTGDPIQMTGMTVISGPKIVDITSGDLNRNGVPEIVAVGITKISGDIPYAYQSIEWNGSSYQTVSTGSYTDPYATDLFGPGTVGQCENYITDGKNGCNLLLIMDVFAEILDVDGDNKPELLANNRLLDQYYQPKLDNASKEMRVWDMMNAGDATYLEFKGMLFSRGNYSVTVGDFTGDQHEDIVFSDPLRAGIKMYGVNDLQEFKSLASFANAKYAKNAYPLLFPANMDNDSLYVQFDRSEIVFTEPIPLAAVAAAPCYDQAWQNTEECTSSYGKGSSVSTATENSYTLEAAIKAGYKGEASVFGMSVFEAQATITASGYYEWAFGSEFSVDKSITYNSGSNEDIVVFASIPYDVYIYKIIASPVAAQIGEEATIHVPRMPVTRQAERSFYNNAVSKYDPSKAIGAETFGHTPGIPSSYPTEAVKNNLLNTYGGEQNGPVGAPQGSGSTEISLSVSQGSSFRENLGFNVVADVEVTVMGVIGGLSFGVGYGHDVNITNTEYSSYSASIGGLDAANFGANKYTAGIFAYPKTDHPSGFTFHTVNFWVAPF